VRAQQPYRAGVLNEYGNTPSPRKRRCTNQRHLFFAPVARWGRHPLKVHHYPLIIPNIYRSFNRCRPGHRAVRARGIGTQIPKRRTDHGSGLGMWRYVVEQTQALLHQFKRLRTRYDRRDDIHEAFLDLGCSAICWRRLANGFF